MVDPVTIRLAGRADAATIHALIRALAETLGKPEAARARMEDFAEHGFSERPAFEALIAEAGSEAVGLSLFFYTFSTWRGRPGVYVQDLYIAPDLRGSGLGRRLLSATAAHAGRRGCTHLRLSVDAANARGQDFYRRLGLSWAEDERIFEAADAAFDRLAAAADD